jgi:hypothetical protein
MEASEIRSACTEGSGGFDQLVERAPPRGPVPAPGRHAWGVGLGRGGTGRDRVPGPGRLLLAQAARAVVRNPPGHRTPPVHQVDQRRTVGAAAPGIPAPPRGDRRDRPVQGRGGLDRGTSGKETRTRTQPGRPWQARIEDSHPVRPARPAADRADLRGQHPRRTTADAAAGLHHPDPNPTRPTPPASGQTARRQGLRPTGAAPRSPPVPHRRAHRPQGQDRIIYFGESLGGRW